MPDVGVVDVVFVGLLIQEIKHILDGQRQGAASMGGAEDGLEQVVHKLLQSTLHRKECGGGKLITKPLKLSNNHDSY